MLLTVVLVTIVQLPPSSEMVITGVEARAAFLRMKPTPRAFRNSSYFSEETCVYVPVMGAISFLWCCSGGVLMCSEVVWLLTARRLTWSLHLQLAGDKQRSSTYNPQQLRSLPGSLRCINRQSSQSNPPT